MTIFGTRDQGPGRRWIEGSSLSLGLALTSVMLSSKGCCGYSAESSSFRLGEERRASVSSSLFDSGTDPAPTFHLSLPQTAISTLKTSDNLLG